jgi:carboxylate-amine ligase
MDAKFTGPCYTLGVEEELMILDGESHQLVNEIEAVIDAYEGEGEVKPELLQSVLEIATPPCDGVEEAGRHVRRLRREVSQAAATRGLAIGSAGTHPCAL